MSARLYVLLFIVLWGADGAVAQPTAPADTFDLVLVGDHLRAETHRVALKTNPTAGSVWIPLDDARCAGTSQLMVLSFLSAARYLGQDIRENHLTLRITTQSSSETRGALRAVYAMPSVKTLDRAACAQIARRAQAAPDTIRHHSLATYERPRPIPLQPGSPFLDHVELPVRHRKPGVLEVEWLNILFGKKK